MPKDKKITLVSRIDNFLGKYDIPKDRYLEAHADLRLIIEQTVNPEGFCEKCNDKLIFNKADSSLKCLNCGHTTSVISATQTSPTPSKTNGTPQSGTIPPQAEEAIKRATKPTALGEQIQKLANSTGGPPPTEEEKKIVEGTTGLKGVNWS